MKSKSTFSINILSYIIVAILTVSCTQKSTVSENVAGEVITIQLTNEVQTSIPDIIAPTKVEESTFEHPIIGQPTVAGSETLNEDLFLVNFDGNLSKIPLSTENPEPLVTNNDVISVWQYAISPNTKYLAYWKDTVNGAELWISELSNWRPEMIINNVDIINADAVNLWWINDQYLLLELGIIDKQLNLFVPQKSYFVDMLQRQSVLEDIAYSYGCFLAPSPKTAKVATWSPAKENWVDAQAYYSAKASYYIVIEENELYWTTIEMPENILIELKSPQDNWVWSRNRELVAFPSYISSENTDSLLYIDQSSLSLKTLEYPKDDHVFFNDESAWSPNQMYLAYIGSCMENECYQIVDINTNNIIWTSQRVPKAQHLRSLAWSGDSQYVAMLSDEGLFIIHVQTGDVVKEIKSLTGVLIIWGS